MVLWYNGGRLGDFQERWNVLNEIRFNHGEGLKMGMNDRIISAMEGAFGNVQKAQEAGMNEHLAKPVDPKKLYATLAKYFPPVRLS